MSANINAIFPLTPQCVPKKVDTACTDRTGATTAHIVDMVTTGANGSTFNRVTMWAGGAVAAAIIWLWIYDGSTYNLYEEIVVTAVTPNTTTTPAWSGASAKITPTTPLTLPTGYKLAASTTVTQAGSVPIFVYPEAGAY